MPDYKITTDLFILPYKNGKSILYAPLERFVFEANQEMVNLLSELESLSEDSVTPSVRTMLECLIQKNIINGSGVFPMTPQGEFSPSQLALFPTNRCNLNCMYCYASDDRSVYKTMDLNIAEKAIDFFISILKKQKKKDFFLEFHGGGEPFMAWDLVKDSVNYAKNRCEQENLIFKVHAATNGVLNQDQLEWIVQHFYFILVSFDGLPHVQDYHRKASDGTGSFIYTDQTIRYFDRHNFPYGIRCAVSRYNEDLLDETVDFITQEYKTKLLIIEPVTVCRNLSDENAVLLKPNLDKFIENYKRLEPICAAKGLSLEYSGARFDRISSTFCHVGTDDFAVTPDGYMTNCWEVTGMEHPLAKDFIFGRIFPNGDISLEQNKLDKLRKLSVNYFEYCKDCFAKWHCSGGCVTKIGHGQYDGHRGGERCDANRRIIAHYITKMLER